MTCAFLVKSNPGHSGQPSLCRKLHARQEDLGPLAIGPSPPAERAASPHGGSGAERVNNLARLAPFSLCCDRCVSGSTLCMKDTISQ